MKKVFLILFAFAFIFSFDSKAFADEGHSHMNHGNGSNMEGMDHGSGHEDMDTNNESDHESGHSHGPVIETPPNYKVLGTYGAVNLAFIAVGIWNKWFRRKGE
ncbi:hypothetical protein [Neobacillus bataviensis]|uniref:hypothetical protein n=1 Tax=Neobacillus bataviensis TaxID=220685 RepID=UPI001CBAEAE8|nr:hypothetical protein [Neobacillus bataviensis]